MTTPNPVPVLTIPVAGVAGVDSAKMEPIRERRKSWKPRPYSACKNDPSKRTSVMRLKKRTPARVTGGG